MPADGSEHRGAPAGRAIDHPSTRRAFTSLTRRWAAVFGIGVVMLVVPLITSAERPGDRGRLNALAVVLIILLVVGAVAVPVGAWKLVRCARVGLLLRRHPWVARRARYRDVYPDLTRTPNLRDRPILLLRENAESLEVVGRVWEFPRGLMELSDGRTVWVCGDPERRAVVALPSGINFVLFRHTTFGEEWMRQFVLHEEHDTPTRWRRIDASFRRR